MRRVWANKAKRDETISLTVAAFNVGTRRGGGVKDRERGGTDGRQTGAISRLDLPLILSVKSCNACACMQYTDTKPLSRTHTCMHKQCICVGVKFFNYFCGLNCISCKGTRQTHEERERERDHKIRRLYQRLAIVIAACGDRQRHTETERHRRRGKGMREKKASGFV